MNQTQEDKVKNRIDSLIGKKKLNQEEQIKNSKEEEVLKKCADEIFSSSNGQKVLKYLVSIKKSYCDSNLLDANPNKAILEKGIRFMYSKLSELIDPKTLFKAELD
jgi:hypothetical protein